MAAEFALGELRKSTGKAKGYWEQAGPKLAPVLRSHALDLTEDLMAINKHLSNLKEKEAEGLDLVSQAKELKRDMEKEAFILEEAAKKKAPAPAAEGTSKSTSSVKAPRIKLPVFDGESSEDYRGFVAAIDDVISGEPGMGAVRKWLLLRQQLSGKALTLVKELPTAPETYAVAKRLLDDAYGSEKRAVTKLYQRVQNLPAAEMTTESLRATHGQLEGILLHLEGLKVPIDEENYLRAVIIGKYPGELAHTLRITDSTKLSDFRKLVSEYIKLRDGTIQPAMVVTTGGTTETSDWPKGGAGGSKAKPRHVQSAQSSGGGATERNAPPKQVNAPVKNKSEDKWRGRKVSCVFCTGEHYSDMCGKHKSLEERLKLVTEHCPRCLRSKHSTPEECRHRKTCYYCHEASHNSALCPKQFAKVLLTQVGENESEAPSRFITAMLPVSDVGKKHGTEARTVLDTCGGRSLITADLASELGLTTSSGRRARFRGANEVPLYDAPSSSYKLWLLPPGARAIEVEVFVVPEIVTNVESTDVAAFKAQYPKYADLPMPSEGNGRRVQLLLGYRSLVSVVTLQSSITVEPHLQLMSTRFGWVPMGTLPTENPDRMDSSVIALLREVDPVKLMSDLELVGLADFLKTEDEEEALVLDKLYASMQRFGKRYEVGWPFRDDDPELDDNFGLAFGRLLSLYRNLSKDEVMLRAYDRLIKEDLEKDIVETVNLRAPTRKGKVHYLPHRAIIRVGKSTPIRIVFDAGAKNGKLAHSLNDLILKGGNWVKDVPAVLLRFRRYGVALTADITRAFHQIAIAPDDRDVVRFLWLRDITKPPSRDNLCVYRFKRMAFGVVASPFLLTAVIRHHLKTYPNEFADIVDRDLYADNLITSLPRSIDGEQFYRTEKSCFEDMSMNMTQWVADCSELRSKFDNEDKVEGAKQGALGLEWDVDTQTLRVKSPRLSSATTDTITKRIALREMATVYDPLRWVSPVILIARLFVRKIWRLDYTWEKALADELAEEWRTIRSQLNQVSSIALMRPYGFGGLENAERIELHTFCDASAEAYGLAVYLCIEERGQTWTGLVASKTRLAPNTKLSIPRLELLAAVTACRYLRYVEQALELKEDTTKYLWGDSRCVIAWTKSKKILPAFVDKSVKIIKEAGLTEFRYVPTGENPADAASRGASIDELKRIDWWRGPVWLADSSKWPDQKNDCEQKTVMDQFAAEHEEEVKKDVNVAQSEGAPFGLNPNDFETMGALLRRTAYLLRAAGRFLRGRGTLPELGPLDYQRARIIWLRWDQQRFYEPANRNKTNVSYLKNLRVSEDENGIMRCHTRLRRAQNEIEPILLVKRSTLTRLLILSFHLMNRHVGTAHTLAALRRQYWLPHGRREVFTVIKEHCHTCRRYEAKPYQTPEMAPLPEFRVSRTETPFTNIGVDVFGPFRVRVGDNRDSPVVKKWVIIFTCLVVRAVHLEVLDEMKATDFLDSFRRFIGRRGVPRIIVCDNAPQFYVVEGIFQCAWRRFAEADVNEKYYAQHGIEWRFVPAHSPWMGGAYERLIQEVKKSFERTYSPLILSDRKFEIALIEIEGILNSRPITYVDKEAETELITPNDFLQTRYPAIPFDHTRALTGAELTAAWRASEEYLEQFWRDWAERYLREIRERRDVMPNPRLTEDRAPMVGEVVLMIDPSQKRSSWRTAVVERLIDSSDGKVRAVQLRSSQRSRMIRPVSKLAPLRLLMEISDDVGELVDNARNIVVDPDGGEISA
ncbi:hypothetical protein V9T40_014421 [Parthenolecanium corni]|uniref:Integrase catalytic domain-containing protein n=1 Tax=Parthenolecanium corni TaxID=536013 RepID=A0AAN9XY92_9HEMI